MPPSTVPVLQAARNTTVTLEGVVVREPEVRERTLQLTIAVHGTRVLVSTDRLSRVAYGDVVRAEGTLQQPEAFATDLGRSFNYPKYLEARGVMYTLSFAEVTKIGTGQGNALIAGLFTLKHSFMATLQTLLPAPQVGLAEGLLLGVKRSLGEEYEEAFRKTGIMHIVVLSGYNIMLVVTFFMFVLALVLPYRLRLLVGIMGIAGFALLVGLSATVVRASVMASLLLLIRFGGMTHNILRALCFAGVVILFVNPLLLLYDVGFQLSFVATLALIILAPQLETAVRYVPTMFGVREFFIATVATQILVTPLLLYHIGEVSLIAVLVNVLVLPMVPVAMLLTFVAGLLAFLSSTLALPVAWLAYIALSYILYVATTFAALPLATVTVPAFSVGYVVLLYGLMGLIGWFYWWWRTRAARVVPVLDTLAGWTIVEESRAP